MTTTVPGRQLLTVAEAAQRLRVSEKSVRRLLASGLLPGLRVGRQIRIDPAELESWLYTDPRDAA